MSSEAPTLVGLLGLVAVSSVHLHIRIVLREIREQRRELRHLQTFASKRFGYEPPLPD